MISEKVENVGVFVDKYLYEYQVGKLRLHTVRRLELASALACLLLGLFVGVLSYKNLGMSRETFVVAGTGGVYRCLTNQPCGPQTGTSRRIARGAYPADSGGVYGLIIRRCFVKI